MTPAPLLLCLCVSLQAPVARDGWFGEDKAKHFVASFVVTSLSASAARAAGLAPPASAWAGGAAASAAGVWKELRDRRIPGETVSLKDLAWDAAGVAAGVALMHQVR
jgi:putative lipoprotein